MASHHRVPPESDALLFADYSDQDDHLQGLCISRYLDFPDICLSGPSAASSSYAHLAAEPSSSACETFEPTTQLEPPPLYHTHLSHDLWRGRDGPWTGLCPASGLEVSSDFVAGSTHAVGQWTVDSQTATLSDDTLSMHTDHYGHNLLDPLDPLWDMASITSITPTLYYSPPVASSPWCHPTINQHLLTSSAYGSDVPKFDHLESQYDPLVSSKPCRHVPPTSPNAHPPSTPERKEPPYRRCPISTCQREFLRHTDVARHMKTKHTTQEQRQGYRCAFQECPKAGKIWTRLDSFKQHVQKWHKGTDVNRLVRKSSRVLHGPDANFPFSVTTPASMSQKRRERGHTRAREQ